MNKQDFIAISTRIEDTLSKAFEGMYEKNPGAGRQYLELRRAKVMLTRAQTVFMYACGKVTEEEYKYMIRVFDEEVAGLDEGIRRTLA